MRFLFLYILFFLPYITYAELLFECEVLECEIPQSQSQYKFSFKFKNINSNSIKIISVKSSCLCIVTTPEVNTYKLNESGEIKGVFNIGNKRGLQEQEIIVHTDNVSQSLIKLKLKINLLDNYEVNSRLLYWEKATESVSKEVTLVIRNPEWVLSNIKYDKNKFTANVVRNKDKYVIIIKPVSPEIAIRDLLKISLENKSHETKTFALHALIK